MRYIALCALLALSCHRAIAQPELPARMDLGDAARLDRDVQHVAQLQREIQRYQAEAEEVCARYKIDAHELGRSVAVNFSTGEILRQATPNQSMGGSR